MGKVADDCGDEVCLLFVVLGV